jgi:hypothetical protein
MKNTLRRIWLGAPWVLLGILTVGLLGGVVRPLLTDVAHTRGVLTAKGGTVAGHGAAFKEGAGIMGDYTLLLSASVAPPVAGDIKMELVGPAALAYEIGGRFPNLPVSYNLKHPWYSLDGDTLRGVVSGDSLTLYVKIAAPQVLGEYGFVMKNAKTGQVYLTMPIVFSPRQIPGAVSAAPPASESSTPAAAANATPAASGEECH